MNVEIAAALYSWFVRAGAYVLVDGQYGSTGKGNVAAALAECFWKRVDVVVSNAGPNSGHTSYFKDMKIVLKQLPTFAVTARLLGNEKIGVFLSAGAVIDHDLLMKEIHDYRIHNVSVHPCAAVITEAEKRADQANVVNIASTGQGVGPALIRKIKRGPYGVYAPSAVSSLPFSSRIWLNDSVAFFEIPQGFSLGINSGFYPHVTSRECSVSQALSDAGIHPRFHRKTIMTVRTFPIRVGNTENSSGPGYPDQHELNWAQLGQPEEMTTVTGRVRRVFTWSDLQFKDALFALQPDAIVLTFCDYLRSDQEVDEFVRERIIKPYIQLLMRRPDAVIVSFGPRSENMRVWRQNG